METKEFRVRPVVRHIVTEFTSDPTIGTAGSGVVGEFSSEAEAEKVKAALEQQSTPLRYILVEESPIAEFPLVRYAYSLEEAEEWQKHMNTKYDIGMRIYSRPEPSKPVSDGAYVSPEAAARMVKPMTLEECHAAREQRIARYFNSMKQAEAAPV